MSPYRTFEDDLLRALREVVESSLDPDDPDREPHPFASPEDIAAAESELGFPLPPPLRAVYGVANGGVGPGDGLYPIGDGEGTLVAVYQQFVAESLIASRDPELARTEPDLASPWPERLLLLCDWGCCTWSCLDCRSDDGPIVTSSYGRLVSTGHTLRSWLTAWLSGVDLYEEMFEPGPVRTMVNPFTKEPMVIKGQGKPKGTKWP